MLLLNVNTRVASPVRQQFPGNVVGTVDDQRGHLWRQNRTVAFTKHDTVPKGIKKLTFRILPEVNVGLNWLRTSFHSWSRMRLSILLPYLCVTGNVYRGTGIVVNPCQCRGPEKECLPFLPGDWRSDRSLWRRRSGSSRCRWWPEPVGRRRRCRKSSRILPPVRGRVSPCSEWTGIDQSLWSTSARLTYSFPHTPHGTDERVRLRSCYSLSDEDIEVLRPPSLLAKKNLG